MKYDKKFKKYINDLIFEYRRCVFAAEYSYDIFWMSEDEEEEDNDGVVSKITKASMIIDATYLTFQIRIYPELQKKWKNKEYSEVKDVILHEMCHLLTQPLYLMICDVRDGRHISVDNIDEVRERQTQRICNSIMFLNDCIDEKNKEIRKLKNAQKKSKKGKRHK